MTAFRTFQECREADGWQPVRVESSTDIGEHYIVLVNPWGNETENICDCKGYFHHGHCKHQTFAANKVCRWREGLEPEQTEGHAKGMICPRCGGPTHYQIEVIDE